MTSKDNKQDMKTIDETILKPAQWQYNDYQKAKQELRAIIEEVLDRVIGADESHKWDGDKSQRGRDYRDYLGNRDDLRDEQRTTAKKELDKLFG